MDRIIHRLTLLGILVFGLCEAYWEVEDTWPENAAPIPKSYIQKRANAMLLEIEHVFGGAIERAYHSMKNDQKQIEESIFSHITSTFNPKAYVNLLKSNQNARIADIEYRKQQSLSDSEKGISTKTGIKFQFYKFSYSLNVPPGTIIRIANHEKRGSDFISYVLEQNTRSVFRFDMNVTKGESPDGYAVDTELRGSIRPGTEVEFYTVGIDNQDVELEWPSRYSVFVTRNSVKKLETYDTPDGREFHETINELKNDTFKQTFSRWTEPLNNTQYDVEEYENIVYLNDSPKEMYLPEYCESSYTVRKVRGLSKISETKLIC